MELEATVVNIDVNVGFVTHLVRQPVPPATVVPGPRRGACLSSEVRFTTDWLVSDRAGHMWLAGAGWLTANFHYMT